MAVFYHGSALPSELRGQGPRRIAEHLTFPAVLRTRLVERRDADALRAIYNAEVLETTVTFDLVARTLAEQVAWNDEHAGSHPAIVAVDDDDRVAGFASVSPYRSRPAYAPTVEDSVYVRRDARGTGVGKLLLVDLVAATREHGFHSMIGRIVGGHDASIALHAAYRYPSRSH